MGTRFLAHTTRPPVPRTPRQGAVMTPVASVRTDVGLAPITAGFASGFNFSTFDEFFSMNIVDAKTKINLVKEKFAEMQRITSFVDAGMFEVGETGMPFLEPGTSMSTEYPEPSEKLNLCWEEIQKNLPSGFSIDGSLIRHLSFNQAHDWLDISKRDISREMVKVEEYEKQLVLIEYLDNLHPEVSRISEIVLSGDIDAALKTVFATLDARIRTFLGIRRPAESTVPAIGKAFNNGHLIAPQPENNDSARNFLQGVVGYYRNNILHNPLPDSRNRIDASLSLFALAHEAFRLFDSCSKQRSLPQGKV